MTHFVIMHYAAVFLPETNVFCMITKWIMW